jgi:UDP-glucuronate 4-epimerase
MKILLTGAAGFIGSHVAKLLADRGDEVVGVDNLNDYYDVNLKHARLKQLGNYKSFSFQKIDLTNPDELTALFKTHAFDRVVHLAAQAGVRYSMVNPMAYINCNIVAFTHILENCRHFKVPHLVYASSSSVYGANTRMPFSVHEPVNHPLSLYGATKKANELMAHSYSNLYQLPTTGLRFFTVYGPWGRPDMVMYLFAKAISEGRPINVFNQGNMSRDFTYIDDIAEGVVRVMDHVPCADQAWSGDAPDAATSYAPYRIYNIGNHSPVELDYVIELLEKNLGLKAVRNLLPMQPGDVPATYANVDDLEAAVGFRPAMPIETGIARFVDWFRTYHSPA